MDRRRFLLASLVGALAAPLAAGAQDAYVYVQGEVRRPGAVKYTIGMTFGQAIALAGGLTATASARDAYLTRAGRTMRVDLGGVPVNPPPADLELLPGDVIRVRERFF